MSLADAWVQSTHYQDGSADFTISIDGDNHMFSASVGDGETAVLSYEETLSWRGEIHVSDPREEVWRLVMQSDEMTQYIESSDEITGIRREKHD